MKPFLIWIAITVILFGAFSGAYHLYLTQNPRKVLVAVDSSFSMKSAWPRVPEILERLENQRYTTFSLVTEKNKIHDWAPTLNLGTIVPYAPVDFSKLNGSGKYAEIDEAGQKYLVTTDPQINLKGWTIIRLSP